MLGLQRTTTTCATTTATRTHEEIKTKGLHVQAPAGTHTHGIAYSALDLLETDHIQALTSWLDRLGLVPGLIQEKRMSSDNVRRTVHATIAFSMCGRLPIRPQLAAPPPAPGIHLVLRSLTPGVYGGEKWIGPRERRVPERECDQDYMQYLSLETPTGTASRGPTGREWQRKGRFGEGATGWKRERRLAGSILRLQDHKTRSEPTCKPGTVARDMHGTL